MNKKKLVIAGSVLVLITALHALLFWGGSGTIIDLIRGNLAPSISLNDRRLRLLTGGTSGSVINVRAVIDTQTPVMKVLPEYLSFTLIHPSSWEASGGTRRQTRVETGSGTRHAPIFDFNRKKLDTLVAGLAPAYLRIGGSEADRSIMT